MIDWTLDLATYAANEIRRSGRLRLMHEPMLGCVVFRYVPRTPSFNADEINLHIRTKLFENGRAVIGRTRVRGTQCLKLTFMNPLASEQQVSELVEEIERVGKQVESGFRETSKHFVTSSN